MMKLFVLLFFLTFSQIAFSQSSDSNVKETSLVASQDSVGTINEAIQLLWGGKIDAGIRIINYNINNRTDSLSYLYYLKGMGYYKQADYKEAYKLFKQSTDIDSMNYRTYAAMGDVLQKKMQLDSSLLYYQKALKGLPDDAPLLNNMGLMFIKKEAYQKGLDIFIRLGALHPSDDGYTHSIAYAYYKLNNPKEALFWINKAIALNPTHSEYYNFKGLTYKHLNNVTEAKKCFQKAISLNPANKNAANNLLQLNQFVNEQK